MWNPDITLTISHWPPIMGDIANLFGAIERAGEMVGEIHMNQEVRNLLSPTQRMEYIGRALVSTYPDLQREVRAISYVGNPCAERMYVANLVYTPS